MGNVLELASFNAMSDIVYGTIGFDLSEMIEYYI